MRSTLFHIPKEVFGLPLFGFGLLLAVWGVVCAAFLAWRVYRYGWTKDVWAELPTMAIMGALIAFVLPAVSDEQGLAIRGYGVLVFLGVASGVALAVHRARREGYPAELIYSLAIWMVVSAIVGARLFYIIEYWKNFERDSVLGTIGAMLKYTEGGLVVYGAFFGGAITAIVFFIRHKLPVLAFCDIIAPCLVLGLALGRIGCFMNGCCYGGQCNLPWAVTFPAGSPPYVDQANRGLFAQHGVGLPDRPNAIAVIESIAPDSPAAASGLAIGDELVSITIETPGLDRPLKFPVDRPPSAKQPLSVSEANGALLEITSPGAKATFDVVTADGKPAKRIWTLSSQARLPRSLPVHPAQLYSSIDAFLITLLLLAWYPFRRRDGEVTALMLTIYPITRFLEEIIRVDEMPQFGTGMSISQNISILMLAATVVLWVIVVRQPRLKYAVSA